MQRPLAGLAAATALVLSLYACSSDSPNVEGQDGGSLPGEDGSSSGGDGPNDPDARADGQSTPDGAIDAAVDGDAADGDAAIDAEVDAEVDAGPPVVRFIGRFDFLPAGGPKVAWPGAQIIARFSGTTEVKATFDDTFLFDATYGPDRWEVLVDGASTQTIQLTRAITTYSLASGLSMGPHTIELYKLTEGNVGTSQFFGFDFTGGTLLPPPPATTRHLQFLGDSSSNGYGVDGVNGLPECTPFSAARENERKSYPAVIARTLSADHHNLSASGKGLYYNNYRPDNEVFSIVYQRAGVSPVAASWSYADYTPDVVWITLGGNDFVGPQPPDPPPAGEFQAKYEALVTTIRTQHPNAHIVCSVAPSLTDAYPAGYDGYTNVKTAAQNVAAGRVAGGDTKVYFFEFTRSTNGDLTACDGHVNAAKHIAMANEAVTFIKSKTNW